MGAFDYAGRTRYCYFCNDSMDDYIYVCAQCCREYDHCVPSYRYVYADADVAPRYSPDDPIDPETARRVAVVTGNLLRAEVLRVRQEHDTQGQG